VNEEERIGMCTPRRPVCKMQQVLWLGAQAARGAPGLREAAQQADVLLRVDLLLRHGCARAALVSARASRTVLRHGRGAAQQCLLSAAPCAAGLSHHLRNYPGR